MYVVSALGVKKGEFSDLLLAERYLVSVARAFELRQTYEGSVKFEFGWLGVERS